jgi:hypothetical protein
MREFGAVAQLRLVAVSNAACRGGWLNVPVPSLGHVDRHGHTPVAVLVFPGGAGVLLRKFRLSVVPGAR